MKNILSANFPPPYIVPGETYGDNRGSFTPLSLLEGGVQANVSISKPGVVRGMHYQKEYPQTKVVACLAGEIHDVCVDMRKGSPTAGNIWQFTLKGGTGDQLFIPKGFAHGFEVVGEKSAMIMYLVDAPWRPEDEGGFNTDCLADKSGPVFNTPADKAVKSERDEALPMSFSAEIVVGK